MKNSLHSSLSFSILFFLLGCSNDPDDISILTQELDASSFTLRVPEGWQLITDLGIDTYIGRIFSESDTIYFDYGYLSFGGLAFLEENDNTISFERLTINDNPSIIVKERKPEEVNHNIRISAYIDSGDRENLNRLYVFDPTINESLILEIFKSHKFN